MATIGNLIINIAANTAQLEAGVKKSQGALEKLNQGLGGLGLGTISAGAAVAGLTKFLSDSVEAAKEAQEVHANLNAVLESTEGIAGVTADELDEMATGFERNTRFTAEATMTGQAMLLTFTKIGSDVFPQATEAMLNMTEKFGNMESASIMLGKALNDPVLGIGALRRVGIQLSAEQEEQIKSFVEMGDVASAQKVILGELETQFGGLAVAMGETTEGQMIIFNNRLGEIQEAVGVGLLPVIDGLIGKLSAISIPLTGANDQLSIMTQYAAELATTPLGAVLDNIAVTMRIFNEVAGVLNDLLEILGIRLGDDSGEMTVFGAIVHAVTEAIRILVGGPLVWIAEGLKAVENTLRAIKSLDPASIMSSLQFMGGTFGGLLGFAEGGVVPGAMGQPRLAVVHGVPAGSWNTHHTFEFSGGDSRMRAIAEDTMLGIFNEYREMARK